MHIYRTMQRVLHSENVLEAAYYLRMNVTSLL